MNEQSTLYLEGARALLRLALLDKTLEGDAENRLNMLIGRINTELSASVELSLNRQRRDEEPVYCTILATGVKHPPVPVPLPPPTPPVKQTVPNSNCSGIYMNHRWEGGSVCVRCGTTKDQALFRSNT